MGATMFAGYSKIRPPLDTYERGLVEYNPATNTFEKTATYPLDAPSYPAGQAFLHTAGGVAYVYFATGYPMTRVRAEPEALTHAESFEAFTCLDPGSPSDPPRVVRAADGTPRWAWTSMAPAMTPALQAKLIRDGKLKPDEGILQLRDATTGKPVTGHNGSVHWNAYRRRWVMIICEAGGTSFLGETWYAEADTPLGPWVYARKVVTHNNYSFYNPKQHPMFDQDGGRVIYFEGTYTHTFSGNDDATPRYDYNQVIYRLDLADPRLNLPVAIYRLAGGIAPALEHAHRNRRGSQPIEIEVRNLDELEQALANGAEAILLDNMSVEDVKTAVDRCSQHRLGDSGARIPIECSGGVRLENVRAYAETGVDFISVGLLTHSTHAVDMSMRVVPA